MFESAPQPNEPGGKLVNATDKRFFWLALYCQPALWVALAIVAVVKFEFIWLTLVGGYTSTWPGAGRQPIMRLSVADEKQSLRWSSQSRIPWLSQGVTSSVRPVALWKEDSILALWQRTLEERLYHDSSAAVDDLCGTNLHYSVEPLGVLDEVDTPGRPSVLRTAARVFSVPLLDAVRPLHVAAFLHARSRIPRLQEHSVACD